MFNNKYIDKNTLKYVVCTLQHTSIVYNTVVQNPFCICQEGLSAAIHFLFNILWGKIKCWCFNDKMLHLDAFTLSKKRVTACVLPSRVCKDP